MQEVGFPTVSRVVEQVGLCRVGVGHSVRVADWEEVPKLAVIVAVFWSVILVPPTVKLPVLLPAATTALAGTVTRFEFELSVTVVFAVGACDKVTVQELVVPDITPLGTQVNALTVNGDATSWMEADADEPL
jgi:hypothetical protein